MRILLTAFEPYDQWSSNSSWETIVELLRVRGTIPNVITRRYPVSLTRFQERLEVDLARGFDSIIHLGPEEYFVLGDNALISGDARYWKVPIDLPADKLHVEAGRVPGRFMLGRAFFVYWPAGFRPAPALPGLAPNFGDMRFIR